MQPIIGLRRGERFELVFNPATRDLEFFVVFYDRWGIKRYRRFEEEASPPLRPVASPLPPLPRRTNEESLKSSKTARPSRWTREELLRGVRLERKYVRNTCEGEPLALRTTRQPLRRGTSSPRARQWVSPMNLLNRMPTPGEPRRQGLFEWLTT